MTNIQKFAVFICTACILAGFITGALTLLIA